MDDTRWIVSSPSLSLKQSFSEFLKYRPILWALVKRDLKSRYRTSFFGFAWAFSKPLMQLFVYTLVIGSILGAGRSIANFSIYIFVGLMFWNFLSESINVGTMSVVAGSGLVTKISFPREILPVAAVLIACVNLIIQVPVLLLGYLITDSAPNFSAIIYVIPLVFSLFFLALGISLILSALNVYARDVQPLTELLVTLLMYLCPIIYSWTFVRDASISRYGTDFLFRIYELNPLTQIISGLQDFFWNQQRHFSDGSLAPSFMGATPTSLWLGAIASMTFMLFCYQIFIKLEPNFAREL